MANLLRAGVCGRINISFTNNGVNLANNVKISVDQIISGDFTFESIFSSTDPALTFNATSKQFELPILAVGTTVSAVIEVTSNVDAAQTIVLNVVSDELDPNPLNNVDAINTTITTANLSPAEKRLNWIRSGALLLVDLGMAYPDESSTVNATTGRFTATFTPLVGEDCIGREIMPSVHAGTKYQIVPEDPEFPEYKQGRVHISNPSSNNTRSVSAFTANNYAAITSGDEYAITMIMMNPDAGYLTPNTIDNNNPSYVWQIVNNTTMTYVTHNAHLSGTGTDTVRVQFGDQGASNNPNADGTIHFKAQYINDYMHLTYAYTSTGGKLIVNGKVMTWFGFTGSTTPPVGDFYINGDTNAGNLVDPLLSRTSLNTAISATTATPIDILQGKRREVNGTFAGSVGVPRGQIPPVACIPGDFTDSQLIEINQGLLVTP